MSSDLARTTMSGVLWTLVGQLLAQGTQYFVQLVLTWFLVPGDFGLVGIATNVTGLVAVFSGAGLAQALVQRAQIDAGHKDTAFWAGLVLGAILTLITAAIAPLVARFYEDPSVTPLLIISALGFPGSAVVAVHGALLRRDLRFKTIARVELLATLLQAAVSTSLAACSLAAYAIVLGTLARLPLATWLYFRASSYRPGRAASWERLRELLGFGGHMTVAGIVDYVAFSIDSFVIPKLLGRTALGIYGWSTRLVTFPLFRVAMAVTAVGFPAFARIQDDKPRLRRAYVRMVRYVAVACFPMMAGLACLADEFIVTCFRAQWHPAAPVVQLLCALGAVLAIGTTVGPVFQSQGRVDLEWKINVVGTLATTAALLLAPREIVAVSLAVVVAKVLMFAPIQRLANRLIDLPAREYLGAIAMPAGLTALMAVAILAVRWLLADTAPWVRLLAGSTAGAAAYALALRAVAPALLAELWALVRRRGPPAEAPGLQTATADATAAVPPDHAPQDRPVAPVG